MDDDARLQVLVEKGHRVTTPRRVVWRVLAAAQGHLTVEELARRVEAVDPRVNLASIYRSLALFDQVGLARESRLGREEAGRWEVAHPDEHFHLVCTVCGEIDHHVGTLVRQVREHVQVDHGFEVESVELTVRGRCVACVRKDVVANGSQEPR